MWFGRNQLCCQCVVFIEPLFLLCVCVNVVVFILYIFSSLLTNRFETKSRLNVLQPRYYGAVQLFVVNYNFFLFLRETFTIYFSFCLVRCCVCLVWLLLLIFYDFVSGIRETYSHSWFDLFHFMWYFYFVCFFLFFSFVARSVHQLPKWILNRASDVSAKR